MSFQIGKYPQEKSMKIDWSSFGIEQSSSVTDDIISQTQKLLGVSFPNSYLDLVTYSDKSSPETSSFPYDGNESCISEFFEFSPDIRPYTIAWYVRAGGTAGLPAGIVPIARDAGDYLVCFNFNRPSITVEIFDPNSSSLYFVANSFEEFAGLWTE
jgi:hypothetical protein